MNFVFYGEDLFFYLLKETFSLKIEKIDIISEKLDMKDIILITDNLIFSVKNLNLSIFKNIFIFSDKIETEFFKKSINFKDKIFFHKREEYIYLEDFVKNINSEELINEDKRIILSDSFKEFVTFLKNIEYFSYDRNMKKSFAVVEGKQYFLRRSLSDIESIIKNKNFVRVERSIILNVNQIKEIDYKEEFIITNGNQRIYLGKNILKKISENYFNSLFKL